MTGRIAGKPSVSVVIDTYNYGRFVGHAIDSVIAQTISEAEREIIIVDDGSVDDTPSIVEKYGDRVRYICKENGGQASAFNVGVAAAQGELICFLDADDYFYPRKLERVMDGFVRNPEVGVIYNRYDVVDQSGRLRRSGLPFKCPQGNIAGRTLLGYTAGSPASGISVRRGVAARVLIPEKPFRLSADHFYLNILPLLTRVGFLPEALHAYRLHGRNLYLGRSDAQRLGIHARQQEALWRYASNELGREFFRAEHDLEGRTAASALERLRIYSAGLRYVAKTDAPGSLRVWTSCKLTARLLLPASLFGLLRVVKTRLLRTGSGF